MGRFRFGQIVDAYISDGTRNTKDRPALIISNDDDNDQGLDLLVITITTRRRMIGERTGGRGPETRTQRDFTGRPRASASVDRPVRSTGGLRRGAGRGRIRRPESDRPAAVGPAGCDRGRAGRPTGHRRHRVGSRDQDSPCSRWVWSSIRRPMMPGGRWSDDAEEPVGTPVHRKAAQLPLSSRPSAGLMNQERPLYLPRSNRPRGPFDPICR